MKWVCVKCGLESDKEFTWAHRPKSVYEGKSDIRTCGGKVVPVPDASRPEA